MDTSDGFFSALTTIENSLDRDRWGLFTQKKLQTFSINLKNINELLYKKGPKFYHASYIVLIQDAGQPTYGRFALNKLFDWTKFVTLQRLAETVSKDVLLCHVQWPTVDDISQFDSPEVVKQFKVQEVIYRRWTSNKNVKDTNN